MTLFSGNFCKNEMLLTKFQETMKTIKDSGYHKSNFKASQNVRVFRGIAVLTENNLQKAKARGLNNFKTDYVTYFYYANKHFRNS